MTCDTVRIVRFGRFGDTGGVACLGFDACRCPRCGHIVARGVFVNTDAGADGAVVLADTGELFDLGGRHEAVTSVHHCGAGPASAAVDRAAVHE